VPEFAIERPFAADETPPIFKLRSEPVTAVLSPLLASVASEPAKAVLDVLSASPEPDVSAFTFIASALVLVEVDQFQVWVLFRLSIVLVVSAASRPESLVEVLILVVASTPFIVLDSNPVEVENISVFDPITELVATTPFTFVVSTLPERVVLSELMMLVNAD
jgi:hypothetical protein